MTNLLFTRYYARPGDTIVVWKPDRLGRSTVQLIELVEELKKREVNLKSLSESIDPMLTTSSADTSSATGNLFFQFMCILAEHELKYHPGKNKGRIRIRQRT